VKAAIESEHGNGQRRFNYRALLRLDRAFPEARRHQRQPFTERKPAVRQAYDEWLFHGPRFQVIEEIIGMSVGGARALLRTTSPAEWLPHLPPEHRPWVFEPGLIDAAAQMALIWGRAYWNETPLPAHFGRVARFAETLPERLYMEYERIATDEPHVLRAHVYFLDRDDNVLLLVEDLKCISSPDLNRLGGTARYLVKTSASR
jgi:hypothetical protein